jgi:hypothetical protein
MGRESAPARGLAQVAGARRKGRYCGGASDVPEGFPGGSLRTVTPRGRSKAQRAAVVVVLAGVAAGFGGRAREPIRTEVAAAAADVAVAATPEPCRSEIAGELRAGQRASTAETCAMERRRASEGLLAKGRRPVFGIVERRTVRLSGITLVLSEAHRCERWPLRGADRADLEPGTAISAGCQIRRYRGKVSVAVVGGDGAIAPVITLRTDDDGQLEVEFAELDGLLRVRGLGGLMSQQALVIGEGEWVGRVDLAAVRAQLADWHLTWVGRGRGVPALFTALHPEHPGAAVTRARALEATLRRQADDAEAVKRGVLTPRRFLERHTWSPYRALIVGLEAESVDKDMTQGTGP